MFLPKKLAAMATEGKLFKISEYKSMSLNFHDLPLANGIPPARASLRHYSPTTNDSRRILHYWQARSSLPKIPDLRKHNRCNIRSLSL